MVGAELPFVLKDIHGSRGEANYVIADESDYKRVIKSVKKNNVYVVGQKFIPNDGDFRILVLGRRIALVIHRSRQDDTTHLNNTSKGGNARLIDLVDLPTHVQTNSLIATKAMGRGVAGVDMVQDLVTKNWYCFEVNAGPQIATGAFLVEKQKAFAQFVKTELGK